MKSHPVFCDKITFKNKLEPFIYEQLKSAKYEVKSIAASSLLTWNRFDLAFKLCYLDHVLVLPELSKKLYKQDIKAQTLGKYVEVGNKANKNNFDCYVEEFKSIYNDIKSNGFLSDKTVVPLSADGSIINGAHRVACAIHLEQNVSAIVTEQNTMVADYNYFFNRDVPVSYLDKAVQTFAKYSDENIHIAFLWPSGKGSKEKALGLFSNVVYTKDIKLSPRGAFNLLYELYQHMDWVGTKEDSFKGIQQKLLECFPLFEQFKVVVFQAENLEQVRDIKQKVRDIYGIGYSSIHITDTKEEVIRISQLLFNENGLHFLNFAEPHKYHELYTQLDEFKRFLISNKISLNDALIDGSVTLCLYGLRKSMDVDFLIPSNHEIVYPNEDFETHDSELRYHGKSKNELIYNDENFFVFNGVKFVCLQQLYLMKVNRNEDKDKNDCYIMKSLLDGNQFNKFWGQLRQKFFYFKVKVRRNSMLLAMTMLKKIGVYKVARAIYRKIKGAS